MTDMARFEDEFHPPRPTGSTWAYALGGIGVVLVTVLVIVGLFAAGDAPTASPNRGGDTGPVEYPAISTTTIDTTIWTTQTSWTTQWTTVWTTQYTTPGEPALPTR